MTQLPTALTRAARQTRPVRAARHAQRGVTAIEYALIAGLIAIAIIASVETVGLTLSEFYGGLANDLSSATRD